MNVVNVARQGPFALPRPKMRGRYFIRQRKNAIAMALIDGALRWLPRRRAREISCSPKRILVANWAHLGDVITTIGALQALRQRYPTAEIGMLVGSWGKPAIAETGLVDNIHVIDHWRVNRSSSSSSEKKRRYRETRKSALQDIRRIGYDVGIDMFNIFPPAHPLFYRAGIPLRIGYDSGGFGPLLSRPVRWEDQDRPMADQYRDLLNQIDPSWPFTEAQLRPRRSVKALTRLPAAVVQAVPYMVLHPGAGAVFKDWGFDHWHDLIARLQVTRPELTIVLTGAGKAETATTAKLAGMFPDVIDLAGRVSWEEFVSVVAHAALVVCPDTATGHVAALFDVPTVSLFTGTNNAQQWRPYSDQAVVLVQPVLCAPCNQSGCEIMACIRDTTVEEVNAAVSALLERFPFSLGHSRRS